MERQGHAPAALLRPELLESAASRPRWAAHYAGADLFHQAATLAVGIALNHPFEDGNKRAAEAACLTFLRLNGYLIAFEGLETAEQIVAIAEASADREAAAEAFADWLRAHATPPSR